MKSAARWVVVCAVVLGSTQAMARDHDRDVAFFPFLSDLILKGGGSAYTGSLGRYSAIGPTYGLALHVPPLPFLAVEVGYDGSKNNVDIYRNPGLANGQFWRNGASALVKLVAPWEQF